MQFFSYGLFQKLTLLFLTVMYILQLLPQNLQMQVDISVKEVCAWVQKILDRDHSLLLIYNCVDYCPHTNPNLRTTLQINPLNYIEFNSSMMVSVDLDVSAA